MPSCLLEALASPNIASKHRIVRQYDHEVQGGSVVKPFVGPMQIGPADAAVIRPKLGTRRGVAISVGMAPHIDDPYDMAVAAIDEAVRNAICVGADPARLAVLDNFCWPGTDDPETLGTLVRSCEACRDVALAWGTPFISGKDSLHNQFTDKTTGRVIRIPRTLLISAIGIVEDVAGCVTSDLKKPGSGVYLVSAAAGAAADLAARWSVHTAVAGLVASGKALAAHDLSDGGWLVAAAEMAIGGGLGLRFEADLPADLPPPLAEGLTTYLIEADAPPAAAEGVRVVRLGEVTAEATLLLPGGERVSVADATAAWRGRD